LGTLKKKGSRGRDHMVVVSSNPIHGEVYSIHFVIKFVSDLWRVDGFLHQ